ncbi:hypothetical protein QWA_11221 [Alcaligenes faecalis subsp. faecalis NCIB 8687]|nr:hypothetical protein QWA_11221 [Alcaligenes faecalis subsp. faecalis NCIB 8687]
MSWPLMDQVCLVCAKEGEAAPVRGVVTAVVMLTVPGVSDDLAACLAKLANAVKKVILGLSKPSLPDS